MEGGKGRDSQLGTATVEDDGVEAEAVQEREREREVVELVGEDGAADPAGSACGLKWCLLAPASICDRLDPGR
jgi:hypothetical protein